MILLKFSVMNLITSDEAKFQKSKESYKITTYSMKFD